MKLRISASPLAAVLFAALLALLPPGASATPHLGTISGVVVDTAGRPQMGASVLIAAEGLQRSEPPGLLTDARGHFIAADLIPGFYSVQVTLAGFLPTVARHVEVGAGPITHLQLNLGTVFESLERLGDHPGKSDDADDWTWVLRSSPGTRPILRWEDGDVLLADDQSSSEQAQSRREHGQVELRTGARHPGNPSNFDDAPATGFAYDEQLPTGGQLLLAGQFGYAGTTTEGGIATIWLPSGENGPSTTMVLKQAALGPAGLTFRGLRVDHEERMVIGDRIFVRYGAEYMMAGLAGTTSTLRPRVDLTVKISRNWTASALTAVTPGVGAVGGDSVLQSAMDSLDQFPTLLALNGRPVLSGDWHEELGVTRKLGSGASFSLAAFHDRSGNTAVFGHGASANPDYLESAFSNVFAYDGGSSGAWGARAAYQRKLGSNFDAEVVYSFAGALTITPGSTVTGDLRDALLTRSRQSVGAGFTARVPRFGTRVTTGYKWIGGPTVSRLDAYGESMYGLDPYLNVMVRQPLPPFFGGRMEVVADLGNLLAQGYVPVTTSDGRVLLFPSYRSLSGGFIFQF
jgi:hypothetical protein